MGTDAAPVRSTLFFGLMAAASAVTIAKLAVVAAVLSAESFALYASAFAAGGFVASALSLGLVEATPKKYTRWAARGHLAALSGDLAATLGQLGLRSIALILLGVGVASLLPYEGGVVAVASVVAIGFAMNVYSVIGSILRAIDRLISLGLVSIIRVVVATIAVVAFGVLAGWQAGLAAEAITSAALALVLIALLRRRVLKDASDVGDPKPGVEDRGGYWLFAAYLVVQIPTSLDRSAITAVDTPETAAQYAFLAIWIAGAYTVASIYIQKFGPDMIRRREARSSVPLLATTLRHATVSAFLIAAASVLSFIVLRYLFADVFWLKYSLGPAVVIAATLAAALQVSPLFDWTLIALDGESAVLAASLVFAAAVAAGFAVTMMFGFGAVGYLTALAAGRLAQGAVQIAMIAARQAPAVTT